MGLVGHLVGVLGVPPVHRPVDRLVCCLVDHLVEVADLPEEVGVEVGVGQYYRFIGASHRLLIDSSPCRWANER